MNMMAYKCTSRGEKEMRKRWGKGSYFCNLHLKNKTRIKWKTSVYEGR
jgi:hypothetical protein